MPSESDANYAEQKDVAKANREFYRSFERLDLPAMRALWLDDERIKCVHPGGEVLTGPTRVHAAWSMIFENTKWIRFELADLSVEIHGDLAWVTNVERIHAKPDEVKDDTLVAEAVATNLFQRTTDGWRMLLHHASPIARRFSGD